MSEYYPGETEDCYANESVLNYCLREQERLEAARDEAFERKLMATNPVSKLIASVYCRVYDRKVVKNSSDVEYFKQLPLPTYE